MLDTARLKELAGSGMFTLTLMTILGAVTDAGVPARAKPALDAGIVVVEPPKPIEKPAPVPSVAEVADLRREVVELKTRTMQLERQSQQADALSAQFEKLSKQIADLQGQMSETENRRADLERQRAERRSQNDQVIASIGTAQQQLASGSAGSTEAAISYAERVLTGSALADVQSARVSLQNGDLASTRIWLNLAVIDAQASNR